MLLALARPGSQPLVQRLPGHPRSQRHRALTLPAPNRSHRRSPTPILNLSQNLLHLLNLTTQAVQFHQARDILGAHESLTVLTMTECFQASQMPTIVNEFPRRWEL
nr:MAG TPA: hypothetical protein [Caudoviricetes sp.]